MWIFVHPVMYQDRLSSLPKNILDVTGLKFMLSLLYYLDFSFKSCNVYAVIPSSDYCTLQLCQAAT